MLARLRDEYELRPLQRLQEPKNNIDLNPSIKTICTQTLKV